MNNKIMFLAVMMMVFSVVSYGNIYLFDFEDGLTAVTEERVAGDGGGSMITSVTDSADFAPVHSWYGGKSLQASYVMPAGGPTDAVWPLFTLEVPVGKNDWTGGTRLGIWFYLDLVADATVGGWTLEPTLNDSVALGKWNLDTDGGDAFPDGLPTERWVYHEWDLSGDLSNVTALKIDIWLPAGLGSNFASVAKNNTVTILYDDIIVAGANDPAQPLATVYNMESSLPPVMSISGADTGTNEAVYSTDQSRSGQSLLWSYVHGDNANNWPIVGLRVPEASQDMSAATIISAWFYVDTIHPMNGWGLDASFSPEEYTVAAGSTRHTTSKLLAWPDAQVMPNQQWFEIHWPVPAGAKTEAGILTLDFNINVNTTSGGTWNNWGIADDTPTGGTTNIYIDNVAIGGVGEPVQEPTPVPGVTSDVLDWELLN